MDFANLFEVFFAFFTNPFFLLIHKNKVCEMFTSFQLFSTKQTFFQNPASWFISFISLIAFFISRVMPSDRKSSLPVGLSLLRPTLPEICTRALLVNNLWLLSKTKTSTNGKVTPLSKIVVETSMVMALFLNSSTIRRRSVACEDTKPTVSLGKYFFKFSVNCCPNSISDTKINNG